MKKLAYMMALVMVLSVLTCGCGVQDKGKTAESENPVVKIGVMEPLTGADSVGGSYENLGVLYAHSQCPSVDIGGTTYDVELVTVDNESSQKKSERVAEQLVSSEVSAVIGSYGSNYCIAAEPVLKEAGIPVIGISCTAEAVTEDNVNYFRICCTDDFQGKSLAEFAEDTFGADTAYCMALKDDLYSTGICKAFINTFKSKGGTVVYEEYDETKTDFGINLKNAEKIEADVIFAPCSPEDAASLIELMKSSKNETPVLGADAWDSSLVAAAAKGAKNACYASSGYYPGLDEEFEEGFKAFLATDPELQSANGGASAVSGLSAMGYDAYFVALEALKAAKSTTAKDVRNALAAVKYSGVTGEIAFDGNGDAIKTTVFINKINTRQGSWEFVRVLNFSGVSDDTITAVAPEESDEINANEVAAKAKAAAAAAAKKSASGKTNANKSNTNNNSGTTTGGNTEGGGSTSGGGGSTEGGGGSSGGGGGTEGGGGDSGGGGGTEGGGGDSGGGGSTEGGGTEGGAE